MSPAQLRDMVAAAVTRAVSGGERVDDVVQQVLDLVERDGLSDFAQAGDALLELVSDAVIFGTGAWVESIAGSLTGEAEELDAPEIARRFLEAYRARRILWAELPLETKISDALTSAQLDARVYGAGFLRVNNYGMLQRLEPTDVLLVVDGHTQQRPTVTDVLLAVEALVSSWTDDGSDETTSRVSQLLHLVAEFRRAWAGTR